MLNFLSTTIIFQVSKIIVIIMKYRCTFKIAIYYTKNHPKSLEIFKPCFVKVFLRFYL